MPVICTTLQKLNGGIQLLFLQGKEEDCLLLQLNTFSVDQSMCLHFVGEKGLGWTS